MRPRGHPSSGILDRQIVKALGEAAVCGYDAVEKIFGRTLALYRPLRHSQTKSNILEPNGVIKPPSVRGGGGVSMNIYEAASEMDMFDVVKWSYRLILGRDEKNPDLIFSHVRSHATIDDVRRTFLRSDEYKGLLPEITSEGSSFFKNSVFDLFPRQDTQGEEGFFIDFLGTRTRCAYLPDEFIRYSGKVYGLPGTNGDELHERAEWIGTLSAVADAKSRGHLLVAELGAGWGPWLVIAAKAAAALSIPSVALVGVEGAREHVLFMLQHFRDNGINPDDHTILHSVIGTDDGTAHFPVLDAPRDAWGAKASYPKQEAASNIAFERVRSVSLASLAKGRPPFDLLHCDVQGAEIDVFPASADVLNARVRNVIVGTHGREIEARLIEFFGSCGWRLEHEQSCKLKQTDAGSFDLSIDGVQIWRNPARLD